MEDLIKHFSINWKLLLAQTVNFFILLYILKRFLYKPIFTLLNTRKERIEQGLKFTQSAETRLANVNIEKEKILTNSRSEALKIVNTAVDAGKVQQAQILKNAGEKAEHIVKAANKHIAEEHAKLEEEFYEEASHLIKEGMARVIGKLPPEEKSKELISEAIRELKSSQK